jgi:hypothetical protein
VIQERNGVMRLEVMIFIFYISFISAWTTSCPFSQVVLDGSKDNIVYSRRSGCSDVPVGERSEVRWVTSKLSKIRVLLDISVTGSRTALAVPRPLLAFVSCRSVLVLSMSSPASSGKRYTISAAQRCNQVTTKPGPGQPDVDESPALGRNRLA